MEEWVFNPSANVKGEEKKKRKPTEGNRNAFCIGGGNKAREGDEGKSGRGASIKHLFWAVDGRK